MLCGFIGGNGANFFGHTACFVILFSNRVVVTPGRFPISAFQWSMSVKFILMQILVRVIYLKLLHSDRTESRPQGLEHQSRSKASNLRSRNFAGRGVCNRPRLFTPRAKSLSKFEFYFILVFALELGPVHFHKRRRTSTTKPGKRISFSTLTVVSKR